MIPVCMNCSSTGHAIVAHARGVAGAAIISIYGALSHQTREFGAPASFAVQQAGIHVALAGWGPATHMFHVGSKCRRAPLLVIADEALDAEVQAHADDHDDQQLVRGSHTVPTLHQTVLVVVFVLQTGVSGVADVGGRASAAATPVLPLPPPAVHVTASVMAAAAAVPTAGSARVTAVPAARASRPDRRCVLGRT